MKKVTLILGAIVLLSGTAAFAGIDGSKHDLASTTTGWYNEICVYCHTPHSANPDVPLWNRGNPDTVTFTMYTSATMNATPTSDVSGTGSAMCLSCHDGATGIVDVISNAPNNNTATKSTATMTTLFGSTANSVLGLDLTSEHPVNVDYTTGAGTDMKTTVGSSAQLVGGKVQCASCHDPHDTTYLPFLYASNDNSAICLSCHDK